MSDTPYDQYETVIGLEAHVQLSTRSKAFCADAVVFGADPNTRVSPVSLGEPGTLPRLNAAQVAAAVRLGLALDCEINPRSYFDRKNYSYVDLPKGFQTTQDAQPICIGGAVTLPEAVGGRTIRLHHIHMEEDAGKSIHDQRPTHSLVDLNRAGTPLLEIVTEPDFRSATEVEAFMYAMRHLVRWLKVGDGNMEQGSLRCDCNVSVRKPGAPFGTRCEVKNMNSMKFARRAIEFERKRQIDLLEAGGTVVQSTLNFDPTTGRTSPLRSKEDAHDYRYFPEPDLPPVIITEQALARAQAELPELPEALRNRLRTDHGLSDYDVAQLTEERPVAQYYLALLAAGANAKPAANLVINKLKPFWQSAELAPAATPVPHAGLVALLALVKDDKISHTVAYGQLWELLMAQPEADPAALAAQHALLQQDDDAALRTLAQAVLADHPGKVAAYRKGKKGLIGFFMGELMKRAKGQAPPAKAKAVLGELLEV